jgi:hypothetical protein
MKTTTMSKRANLDRPQTGAFQDQARLGVLSCFGLPSGPWRLRALVGASGGRCFSSAYPDPGINLVLLNLGANPEDRRASISWRTHSLSTSGVLRHLGESTPAPEVDKVDDDRNPHRDTPSSHPNCLLHAEAKLRPKKAFKSSVQKTDAAGACGLSLVRCGELAHAALGRDSPLIQRMKGVWAGESPQIVDALLGIVRDSVDELKSLRKRSSKLPT